MLIVDEIMYFGTLRTFLRSLKCTNTDSKRFTSSTEINRLLKPYFDFSDYDVVHFTRKHKLQTVDTEQLDETLQALNSLGYSSSEVADNPVLLKKTSRLLEVQYNVLVESGFCNLSAETIAQFRSVIHKKIKVLKNCNYIPKELNVPETLVSHLHPKPEHFETSDLCDNCILSQVHSTIVKRYLEWRLEATSDEIEQLFRTNSLKFKTLKNLCENLDLAFDLGFSKRKLLTVGYLLHNNPEYPKYVLREIPNLAGADMKKEMRMYPKLVTVKPKNYNQIYEMLKAAQFSDKAIRSAMNIFTLAPRTIKLRLDEINEIPELKVLLNNPNVLKLIVHHNRARSRLSFLQQLQLKCANLWILDTSQDELFIDHLKRGKDVNRPSEVFNLVTQLLKCDKTIAYFNLRKHPFYLHVPLLNMQATIKHLQKKFSNESIVKVLPLVLYPAEKIDRAMKQIVTSQYTSNKRLSESKTLNLLLYFIERDYHFTGNGIWNDKEG